MYVNWKERSEGKPLYAVWHNLKNRCNGYSPNCKHRYHDRGITYDPDWKYYQNFEDDILPIYEEARERYGPKVQLTIDRIDNDGDYEKDNIRFVSPKESAWNKGDHHWITYNGITLTLTQWAGMYRITKDSLVARLQRGWTTERALNEPMQKGHEARG